MVLETWEKWRGAAEGVGLEFAAAEHYPVVPGPGGPNTPYEAAAAAAWPLIPLIEDLRPDVIVADILTLAPALAAEKCGRRVATLIPHVHPGHEPGRPFFASGAHLPRSAIGRAAWRAAQPLLESGLRRGQRELNEARASLSLPPVNRFHGGLSEGLTILATLPQLEYPRRWPSGVSLTGPLVFELPHPDVEVPDGDDPLVLVAPSTSQDPSCRLVRAALEGLADEPVRVVATTNRQRPERPIEVPPNAVLVDWLSYSQLMPLASLVICHGGHGTVVRSLMHGTPVLACPAAGDMAENAARISWSGTGLSVPWRLCRPAALRWSARRILNDPSFSAAASAAARWASESDPSATAVSAVERYARA